MPSYQLAPSIPPSSAPSHSTYSPISTAVAIIHEPVLENAEERTISIPPDSLIDNESSDNHHATFGEKIKETIMDNQLVINTFIAG